VSFQHHYDNISKPNQRISTIMTRRQRRQLRGGYISRVSTIALGTFQESDTAFTMNSDESEKRQQSQRLCHFQTTDSFFLRIFNFHSPRSFTSRNSLPRTAGNPTIQVDEDYPSTAWWRSSRRQIFTEAEDSS